MNIYIKLNLILSVLILISCGDNNSSRASIKDNSIHKQELGKQDYTGIVPEKLLKYIQAHYDLGQYVEGKEKLNYLMAVYPDTLNGVNLINLKLKIDQELLKKQRGKQDIADAEIAKRLPNAIKKMRKVAVGKTTFYYDKSSPEFDTKECFYAYIEKDIYGAHLKFKTRYVGTAWLDMQNLMVTVDKLDYTIEVEIEKKETKGKKAYKHEVLDFKILSPEQMKILKAIANGQDVLALLIGKDTYKKRVITKQQLIAIRNVIDAFMSLDGNNLDPIKQAEVSSRVE